MTRYWTDKYDLHAFPDDSKTRLEVVPVSEMEQMQNEAKVLIELIIRRSFVPSECERAKEWLVKWGTP